MRPAPQTPPPQIKVPKLSSFLSLSGTTDIRNGKKRQMRSSNSVPDYCLILGIKLGLTSDMLFAENGAFHFFLFHSLYLCLSTLASAVYNAVYFVKSTTMQTTKKLPGHCSILGKKGRRVGKEEVSMFSVIHNN